MITLLNLKIDFEQFNVLDDVEVTAVDANGVAVEPERWTDITVTASQ